MSGRFFPRSFLAIGMVVAGCSGGATAGGSAGGAGASACPPSECIVGEGASRDDRLAAETQARARVAEQVASSLSSAVDVTAGVGGGRDDESARSVVHQEASFRRAELIRIESSGCGREGCRAVAVLRRADLAVAMADEYRAAAGPFRAAAARVLGGTPTLAEVAAGVRQAEEAFFTMMTADRASEVAARQPIPDRPGDRALMDRVEAERDRRLAAVRLAVALDPSTDPELRERLSAELVPALALAGANAGMGACSPGALALDLQGAVACNQGHLGVVCRVTSRGTLRECDSGAVTGVDLGEVARGGDPRDEARARASVLKKLDRQSLRWVVSQRLGGLLPLK